MQEFNKIKVFVVDDDQLFATQIIKDLNLLEISDIQHFQNGYSCLHNLDKQPTVIFLDHYLDDIKGYDVLKKIKRYDPNIYVIMVSSQEDIKVAVDALKLGAFDYIQKRLVNKDELDKVLTKVVQVIKLIEENRSNNFGKFLNLLSL